MKFYGLYNPTGKLVAVDPFATECWAEAFMRQPSEFTTRYWKQLRPSQNALKKLGWKVVEVSIKPARK